jgi:hypothetical protein
MLEDASVRDDSDARLMDFLARVSCLASNLDPGFDPQSMHAASPLPTDSALWPSCAQDTRTHQLIRT